MNALDVVYNILNNNNLSSFPFKYCLVDNNKVPHNLKGELAKPNNSSDFSYIEDLPFDILNEYKGLGISIQSSNITAIDVDHCFKEPFNLLSCTSLGEEIMNLFKNHAYIEFSFSGTGMRIFFINDHPIENYQHIYYIKNSKLGIEFYEPYFNARYVTITGKHIFNNPIKILDISVINNFLNNYMVRPLKSCKRNILKESKHVKNKEEYMLDIKKLYFKNSDFQNVWFSKAPGSNSNESELDYKLLSYIYDYITDDVEMVKILFMESPFYKSKDWKHINKFTKNNYNYFYYVMNKIS